MRFRRAEWDVAMPPALVAYWTAWNETDLSLTRQHLTKAVTDDIEWNDHRDTFVGVDHLQAAIHDLRTSKPKYHFSIASEIDHHHDRYRYRWDMVSNGRTLMEGLDITTVAPASGLICRVDGFFGPLSPLDPNGGVPASLQAESSHA